jgi:hypothetical protein
VPHFEQAHHLEDPEGVADRSAADAELLREQAFGGERPTGGEGSIEKAAADPIGDLLGNSRLLEGRDQLGLLDTR